MHAIALVTILAVLSAPLAVVGLDMAAAHRIVSESAKYFDPAMHMVKLTANTNCQDASFTTDFNTASQACSAIASLSVSTASPDTIQAAFNSICTTSCPSAMATLQSKWQSCLTQDSLAMAAYLQVGCERDNRNEFCAVTMTRASLASCETRSQVNCGAPYQCRWSGTRCLPNLTTTYLDTVCNNCIQKIINHLSNFSSGTPVFLANAARQTQLLTCSQVDSDYCVPRVDAAVRESAMNSGYLTNATIATVCQSSTTYRCYNKVSEGVSSAAIVTATADFRACAALNANDHLVDLNCVSAYVTAWKKAAIDARVRKHLCQQNGNFTYCVSYMPAVLDTCTRLATCTSTCNAINAALVNSMQCCVGTVEEVVGIDPAFPALDLPVVGRTSTFTPAPTSPLSGSASARPSASLSVVGDIRETNTAVLFLALNVSACAPTNLSAYLWLTCPYRYPTAVQKSMTVRLVYSALTTEIRGAMLEALRQDVARAIGVTEDSIINGTLTEASSVRITVVSTTTAAGTDTVSASTYTFQLQTSPEIQGDASSSFDSMSNSRSIPLTSTSTVVTQTCVNSCVGQEGISGLNPDEQGSTSGAASVAVFATAIVALFALVL